MFRSKEKEREIESKEDHKKIKELRRKNLRYEGLILLGALQISALVLCYYLGKSKK